MTKAQADYYARIGLFPQRIKADGGAALRDYIALRRNLYERHLSVPFGLLRDQEVLDLGCGTGEAAAVCALMGARLTLVDADTRVWAPLNELFKNIDRREAITGQITSAAETYIPAQDRFALAMAEGFLFTCPNRDQVIGRLMNSLQPSGLLSVSYPDRLGSFMEFLKKAAFVRACALQGIEDLLDPQAVQVGREILGDSHLRLPKPRPFDVWLKDCICSPFLDQRYCWSAVELMAAAPEGLYYSSSPSIHAVDRLGWYKNVASGEEWNKAAIESCEARAADFIFGMPVQIPDRTSRRAFAVLSLEFLSQLGEWFASPTLPVPQPAQTWFDAVAESDLDRSTFEHLRSFFAAFATTTPEEFASGMKRSHKILNLWGKSYHYLVIMRNWETAPHPSLGTIGRE